MNILLISAPKLIGLKASRGSLPVALLYLASSLRKAGHNPILLDFSILDVSQYDSPYEIYESIVHNHIAKNAPVGFVGINCFSTMHFPLVRKLMQTIKRSFPDLKICLGGAHPTFYYREILENCVECDYVTLGEGEEQVVALANVLSYGDDDGLAAIQSFAYRNSKDNEIKVNPRVSYVDELDTLPPPAYDLVHLENYYSDHSNWYNPKRKTIKLAVPILTTRSCPFNCIFCSAHTLMGRKLRRRDPLKVVDEIEYLVNERDQHYFTFVDDNVNANKKHFIALCNEIYARKLDIQIAVSQGMYLNSVDDEVIEAFVKAGGITVSAPIESGSDFIRNDIIGKKLDRKQIYKAVDLFHKYNLFTVGLFIMGFEEDTPKTLDATIALIEELRLDVNAVSTLVPFPGTRIYEQAKRNGTLLFDDSNIWEGDVFFDPQNKQQFFIKPPNLEISDLTYYRDKFSDYYFFSERAKSLNPR